MSDSVPVLIAGLGPVGATLANLLGAYGVRTVAIDTSTQIHDYPRAVGIDDEALRTFQSAGVVTEILRDTIQNVPMRMYGGNGRCMAEIQPTTRDFGFFRRNIFSQPLAEVALRAGLRRFEHVELRLGTTLTALQQDDSGVTATLVDAVGACQTLRAQYVVACDGGRSSVRELLGVPFTGRTHAAKWVVLECQDDPIDAPFTALHCDPGRPYVCLRLPYGLRRWEFMLFPGEDGEQMLSDEKVHQLLSRHVADSRRLKIIRARVYAHNSRVAENFQCGRVCLAGDAAHISPPWIGQGLNAGLRDAFNLAWKLAWIIDGRLKPECLASYHNERSPHARAMVDLADTFGAILSLRNGLLAWCRDRFLTAIQHIPPLQNYILQMKFKPMPRFDTGLVMNTSDVAHDRAVGRMFIQPQVESAGKAARLDDVVGNRFALLCWERPSLPLDESVVRSLRLLNCACLLVVRSRAIGHKPEELQRGLDVVAAEDVENVLSMWFKTHGADWVLMRPDRFVAAFGRIDDAQRQLAELCARLLPASPSPPSTEIQLHHFQTA